MDFKRHARQYAEELFNAQRLQIEVTVMEHYKKSFEYYSELREYATEAFLTYFDEVIGQ